MAKKAKKKRKKKVKRKPIPNGRNGKGQFKKDNKAAVGRKDKPADIHAKELKKALLGAVTKEDIEDIAKKLISEAKEGNIPATKELFDRLWGRAVQVVDIGENTAKTIFDILAVCGLDNDNSD